MNRCEDENCRCPALHLRCTLNAWHVGPHVGEDGSTWGFNYAEERRCPSKDATGKPCQLGEGHPGTCDFDEIEAHAHYRKHLYSAKL